MTLSRWLRDYLYIPLGGNRRGEARTYLNLMTVMLLGGLWHGASWNFVIWGAIHGGMLAAERAQGKSSPYRRLPRAVRVGITFVVVCLSWVFFRAKTLPQAVEYLRALFGLTDVGYAAHAVAGSIYTPYHVAMLGLAAAIVWGAPNTWVFTSRITIPRAVGGLALLALSLLLMWTQTTNPFLYFQF
jgi:alginate O-acetyltransferase complex protein AlgI